MTNQCNLKCTYCDWEKHPYHKMTDSDYAIAKENIKKTREVMDRYYPEYCLVQYSGGEPFLYPKIVGMVLDEYADRWIRINTNGLLFSDEILQKVKEHKKTYLAISIDGCTLKSMEPRVGKSASLLKSILSGLDKAVKMEIPIMILCTLNMKNISDFPEFVDYLESRYMSAIEKGMLVMPTHCVTSYSIKHDEVEGNVIDTFEKYIRAKGKDHPLIKPILNHYDHMIFYLRNNDRKVSCTISDWTVSMHFRGNSIVDDGFFLGFGCGMRGVRDLGTYDINDDNSVANFVNSLKDVEMNDRDEFRFKEYDVGGNRECSTKCFPDWIMFDLILSGQVEVEKAKDWFILFKDTNVQQFISNYVTGK